MLKFNPKSGEWEGMTGGVNIAELSHRKLVKEIPNKEEEIRQEIMGNPRYAYAVRLTEYISNYLGLKLGKTIFRNRRSSCYQPRTKQIYLSYGNIDRAFETGFAEYARIGHVWLRNGYKGQKSKDCWKFEPGYIGIWMIVLHELAHAIQDIKDGFDYGSVHNEVFVKELNDLIVKFPFDKVKNV